MDSQVFLDCLDLRVCLELKEWVVKMGHRAHAVTQDLVEILVLMEKLAKLDHLEPWDPVV